MFQFSGYNSVEIKSVSKGSSRGESSNIVDTVIIDNVLRGESSALGRYRKEWSPKETTIKARGEKVEESDVNWAEEQWSNVLFADKSK